MKITEKRYLELTKELQGIKASLESSLEDQAKAAAAGDLSENEEYATARANSERLGKKKRELESLLAEAEVTAIDRSPQIVVGSTVDVTVADSKGNPLGESRRFVLEISGNTVLDGILGVDSPLGREVLNGTDGVYFVHSNGGIYYLVKKVIGA